MSSALERLKAAQAKRKAAAPKESKSTVVVPPTTSGVAVADTEVAEVQALAPIVDISDIKMPLDKRVWQAFNTPKTTRTSIPIVGYSTVEMSSIFPHDNMNSVRRIIWKFRKENKVVDSGIRRAAKKGGVALTVWIPVNNSEG